MKQVMPNAKRDRMTIREEFAVRLMSALITNQTSSSIPLDKLAETAAECADALILALEVDYDRLNEEAVYKRSE